MFKLVIQDDEGKTTIVPLIRDEITIGRKEGNTIRLTERNVSRRHARIVRANGAVAIEDLGSYNGVRVNGTRIAHRTSLTISDRVQIGDYLIELKAEGVEHISEDAKTKPIEKIDPLDNQVTQVTLIPQPPMAARGAGSGADDLVARSAPVPATAVMPAAQTPARLVVLSSNFAGQTWPLVQVQTIIGRADDNDIVINHRSVSKNHARLTRDADGVRYTISDLKSSNGVRVNGEEYGKVELRRGDVIDLGHVRLRFLEAGEDFVLGRDAQIADVPGVGGNRNATLAAVVILLAVGGVSAYVLTRGDDDSSRSRDDSPVTVAIPHGTVLDAAVEEVADAALVVMAPGDAAAVAVGNADDKASECREFREQKKWNDLQLCGQQLLDLSPRSVEAAEFLRQGEKEITNSLHWDSLRQAAADAQYEKVIETFKKIDKDSTFAAGAQSEHDRARAKYTEDMTNRAKENARDGKCKNNETLASQIAQRNLWPEVLVAVRKVPCAAAGTQTTTTTHNPPPPPPPPPPKSCDAEALVREARDAFMGGGTAEKLQKAEAALACKPGDSTLLKWATMASCKAGNVAKSRKYYKLLKAKNAEAGLTQTCVRDCPACDVDKW
jgi:pSer/pThr/pTyr-binding forkhead associated (FHA) protein